MRAALCALALLALGGCGGKKGDELGVMASASAPPAVSARRPSKRYFLERTAERCAFYFVDGETRSEATKTPCPMELEVGERLRIAGRTCTRESSDPARVVPVVCPDPLTNFEKNDKRPRN